METTRKIDTLAPWNYYDSKRPTAITFLITLNILSMLLLALQWFQIGHVLDSMSSFDRDAMSESLRTTVSIYSYGLPIVIALSGALAVGLKKRKNWARLGMRGLYSLSLVSAASYLFNGGLDGTLVLDIGLAITALVLLSKNEVKIACLP